MISSRSPPHTGVLDEGVCFNYWADELMVGYRMGCRVIEHVRKSDARSEFAFRDMEKLNPTWLKRHEALVERLGKGDPAASSVPQS